MLLCCCNGQKVFLFFFLLLLLCGHLTGQPQLVPVLRLCGAQMLLGLLLILGLLRPSAACAPETLWSATAPNMGSTYDATLSSDNSTIFILSLSSSPTANLLAVSAATGDIKWSFNPAQALPSGFSLSTNPTPGPSVLVLEGNALLVVLPMYVNRYTTYSNYTSLVLCLGASNGAIRWQRADLPQAAVQTSSVLFGLGGDPRGLPAVAANGDIAVDAGGYLSLLSAASGATLWSVPLSSTALKRGAGLDPTGSVLVTAVTNSSATSFVAYSTAAGGAILWSYARANKWSGNLVARLTASALYAVLGDTGSNSAQVLGLATSTGALVLNAEASSSEYLNSVELLVVPGGRLLVRRFSSSLGTSLASLSASSGVEAWV